MANVWLEGTYSEIYDEIPRDLRGMTRLFRQFSTPGGIPSHVSVPTPGSIHEGGELGYALVHGFGAVFDNPDLLVACVVGDGEAETAPLEGAWKSMRFLNAARDGAVLPILHLNEYKISGPTVLGRATDDDIRSLLSGHGYEAVFVEGDDPPIVHRQLAAALDYCVGRIDEIQADARARGAANVEGIPRWPALVMRTPKGWTGPSVVDGVQIEGTFRSHQVPVSDVTTNPAHLAILEIVAPQLRARATCSTTMAGPSPMCSHSSPTARCGWERIRTPTAVGSSSRSSYLTQHCSPCRSQHRRPSCVNRRVRSAKS